MCPKESRPSVLLGKLIGDHNQIRSGWANKWGRSPFTSLSHYELIAKRKRAIPAAGGGAVALALALALLTSARMSFTALAQPSLWTCALVLATSTTALMFTPAGLDLPISSSSLACCWPCSVLEKCIASGPYDANLGPLSIGGSGLVALPARISPSLSLEDIYSSPL